MLNLLDTDWQFRSSREISRPRQASLLSRQSSAFIIFRVRILPHLMLNKPGNSLVTFVWTRVCLVLHVFRPDLLGVG
jgi:hypothetical protein